MRRIYEFRCSDGHTTEKYIDYETVEIQCQVCEKTASRIISPVRVSLDGTDPVYVSAYDRWAKRHEDKQKQEAKQNA
jgi:hypothetical protein